MSISQIALRAVAILAAVAPVVISAAAAPETWIPGNYVDVHFPGREFLNECYKCNLNKSPAWSCKSKVEKHGRFMCSTCMLDEFKSSIDLFDFRCSECSQLFNYSGIVKYIANYAVKCDYSGEIADNRGLLVAKILQNVLRHNTIETFIFSLRLEKKDLTAFLIYLYTANSDSPEHASGHINALTHRIEEILREWASSETLTLDKLRLNNNSSQTMTFLYQLSLRLSRSPCLKNHIHAIIGVIAGLRVEDSTVKEFIYAAIAPVIEEMEGGEYPLVGYILRSTITRTDDFTNPVFNYILKNVYLDAATLEGIKWAMLRLIFVSEDEISNLHFCESYLNSANFAQNFDGFGSWILKKIESFEGGNGEKYRGRFAKIVSKLCEKYVTRDREHYDLANFLEITRKFKMPLELQGRIDSAITLKLKRLTFSDAIRKIEVASLLNKNYIYDRICAICLQSDRFSNFKGLLGNTTCAADYTMTFLCLHKLFECGQIAPPHHAEFMGRFRPYINQINAKQSYFLMYMKGYILRIAKLCIENAPSSVLRSYVTPYKDCFSQFAKLINNIWTELPSYPTICHLYGLNLYFRKTLISRGIIQKTECLIPAPPYIVRKKICALLAIAKLHVPIPWMHDAVDQSLKCLLELVITEDYATIDKLEKSIKPFRSRAQDPPYEDLREYRDREACLFKTVSSVGSKLIRGGKAICDIHKFYLHDNRRLWDILLFSQLRQLCFIRAEKNGTMPRSLKSECQDASRYRSLPDGEFAHYKEAECNKIKKIASNFMTKFGLYFTFTKDVTGLKTLLWDFVDEVSRVDFNEGINYCEWTVRNAIRPLLKGILEHFVLATAVDAQQATILASLKNKESLKPQMYLEAFQRILSRNEILIGVARY